MTKFKLGSFKNCVDKKILQNVNKGQCKQVGDQKSPKSCQHSLSTIRFVVFFQIYSCNSFAEQVVNENVDGDQSETDEDVENDEAEEEEDDNEKLEEKGIYQNRQASTLRFLL